MESIMMIGIDPTTRVFQITLLIGTAMPTCVGGSIEAKLPSWFRAAALPLGAKAGNRPDIRAVAPKSIEQPTHESTSLAPATIYWSNSEPE